MFYRSCLVCMLVICLGCNERPSAVEVTKQQAVCGYKAGMLAADTVPAADPVGGDMPFQHIILLMQENRSFDHYYSELDIPDIDAAPRTDTNTDSKGNVIQRFHFTSKCMGGGDHGWDAQHGYLDGGKLDGFVKGNNDSPTPMGYYDGGELPYYYALSKTFAISDRHFCSVLGPTWPNRMFYFAGTSWGFTDNNFPPTEDPKGVPYKNLLSELDDAKITWRVYSQDYPTPAIVALPLYIDDQPNFMKTAKFMTDVQNGELAQVTIVEASDVLGSLSPDEGPPGDVDIGQQFTSGVIGAIMNSPFWKESVIFLSYDENGGMYDHVVPPAACPPDDIAPTNGGTVGFDQYGFRVPFFAISPYARRGYVSHVVTDHTSILRFVEARFGLRSMSRRDANATLPYDMFDFQHPDFSVPELPVVTVDQTALAACPM